MLQYADWRLRTHALLSVTKETSYEISDRLAHRVIPDWLQRMNFTSVLQRTHELREAFRPVALGAVLQSLTKDNIEPSRDPAVRRVCSSWDTTVNLAERAWLCSIFAIVEPVVFDGERELGYFPLSYSITLPISQLRQQNLCTPDFLVELFDGLRESIIQQLEDLDVVVPQHRLMIEPEALQSLNNPPMTDVPNTLPHSDTDLFLHDIRKHISEELEPMKALLTIVMDNRSPAPTIELKPKWDNVARKLTVANILVKKFKQEAVNQEAVLNAFQEENWPALIEDPIPPHRDRVASDTLRETVRALNENQKNPCLKFECNGRGQVTFQIDIPE
jgi:hypothetical protein